MRKRIREQVVVITGASSGIGLACAQSFAREGAKVVLAARNARDLERAVDEIRRAGGQAVAVPCDVTVYDQVEHVAHCAIEKFGRIDAWVNNAAVSLYGTFKQVSLDDVRRIMDTNFMGQIHGAKAVLPHLERTAGALICVGSALSDRGIPLQGAYCAAKHAIKGWLESLRTELQQEGSRVRVTLVKPSSIDTPLFRKAKTHLGVEPQPVPPVYVSELAVAAIRRAAEDDVRDIFAGGAGEFLSLSQRISPVLVDWYMRRKGAGSQKTTWPKRPDGPNNLYAPVEHDGGVAGDFGLQAKHRTIRPSILAGAGLSVAAAWLLIRRRSVF